MKVKELIKILLKERQEAEILIIDTNGNTYDPVKMVNEYGVNSLQGEDWVQIQIELG